MVCGKIWIISYNLKCCESHTFVEILWPQKWGRGRKITFLMSEAIVNNKQILGFNVYSRMWDKVGDMKTWDMNDMEY